MRYLSNKSLTYDDLMWKRWDTTDQVGNLNQKMLNKLSLLDFYSHQLNKPLDFGV